MFSVDTVKYWAEWDISGLKVPKFTLFQYSYYIPTEGLYVFKQRNGPRTLAYNLTQLKILMGFGSFKPFVYVSESRTSYAV